MIFVKKHSFASFIDASKIFYMCLNGMYFSSVDYVDLGYKIWVFGLFVFYLKFL